MKKSMRLNVDATVAWMFVWDAYYFCGEDARRDPAFLRLMLNLMRSYPVEFEAVSAVRYANLRLTNVSEGEPK